MEKNYRKAKQMHLLSFRSIMNPWWSKFDHWALPWCTEQFSFVSFYMLTTENFKNSQEKYNKRGKFSRGFHYLWLTLYFKCSTIIRFCKFLSSRSKSSRSSFFPVTFVIPPFFSSKYLFSTNFHIFQFPQLFLMLL